MLNWSVRRRIRLPYYYDAWCLMLDAIQNQYCFVYSHISLGVLVKFVKLLIILNIILYIQRLKISFWWVCEKQIMITLAYICKWFELKEFKIQLYYFPFAILSNIAVAFAVSMLICFMRIVYNIHNTHVYCIY